MKRRDPHAEVERWRRNFRRWRIRRLATAAITSAVVAGALSLGAVLAIVGVLQAPRPPIDFSHPAVAWGQR